MYYHCSKVHGYMFRLLRDIIRQDPRPFYYCNFLHVMTSNMYLLDVLTNSTLNFYLL
jgi:hypothetical protein